MRWTGRLIAPLSGPWRFTLDADDEAVLWLDGREVMRSSVEGATSVDLVAGRLYAVRIDHRDGVEGARCRWRWSHAQQPEQFVPALWLQAAESERR